MVGDKEHDRVWLKDDQNMRKLFPINEWVIISGKVSYFNKNNANLLKNNPDICSDINSHYSGKDVLFLSQSNGRYLSSWLNIMRDDFGCISFLQRSSNRNLIYNPSELNDETLKSKIQGGNNKNIQ